VTAALVGTDRRRYRRGDPGPASGAVPAEPSEGPAALLADAAALALYRRAGRQPVHGVQPQPAAGAESRPQVSRLTAARLRVIVDEQGSRLRADERAGLLIEWLELARDNGRRVPGSVLPDLLDAGSRRVELRARIGAVGGERARWLAGQRADWAWYAGVARRVVASALDVQAWDEGLPADRVAYLTELRATDPARARELLVGTWATEPPAQRVALLHTLRGGLSRADEAFLEQALDDRRKEVRAAAQALLAVLPGSAYRQRMTERMRHYVGRGGGELEITLPVECDAGMVRDGIEARAPRGIGERAYWFEQAVARTPLEFWDPPDQQLASAGDEWGPLLQRGWAMATVQQANADWAAALTASGLGRRKGADHALILAVYDQLRPDDAIRLATKALADQEPYAEYLLSRCPRPWPAALSDAVLRHLAQPRRRGTAVGTIAEQAMLGLPPDQLAEVRVAVDRYRAAHPQTFFGDTLDRLLAVLNFRHEMHQEFTSD
jgi:hypothetical protein